MIECRPGHPSPKEISLGEPLFGGRARACKALERGLKAKRLEGSERDLAPQEYRQSLGNLAKPLPFGADLKNNTQIYPWAQKPPTARRPSAVSFGLETFGHSLNDCVCLRP